MKKISYYILTILFLLFLATPYIVKTTNLLTVPIKDENRTIAQKPEIDIKHLDDYPKNYEAYYNDNFGLRSIGVKLYNEFNYFFLKKSPSPEKAILGKNGWLFKGEDINQYRGKTRFTEQELTTIANEFNRRDNFLKLQKCKFVYVIVPGKKEIYSEYIPNEYFRYTNKTLTDQVIEILRNKTNIQIIDLRPTLKDTRNKYPVLYHKLDNHWNDIGAFFSYEAIIDSLKRDMEITPVIKIENYSIDTTEDLGGSIANMLGLKGKVTDYRLHLHPNFVSKAKRLPAKYKSPERFPYSWAYERRFENSNKDYPRLMMIHDSFGEYLYKYLPEHFSYSLYLFDVWEFKLHAQKVLEEKPDIFILATVEELIPNILKNIHREENKIPE